MAFSPKLNIYKVSISSRDNSCLLFRDLFKRKFNTGDNVNDTDLFKKLFEEFIQKIGNDSFRNDPKLKKVIGIKDVVDMNGKGSIHYDFNNTRIYGIIDGGSYGVIRRYSEVSKKEEKITIGKSQVVLDSYFVCLYTPLNASSGYLFNVSSMNSEQAQLPTRRRVTDRL